MTEDQMQLHCRQGQAEDVLTQACLKLRKQHIASNAIARAPTFQELDRRRRQMDRIRAQGIRQTEAAGAPPVEEQNDVLQQRRAEQMAQLPASLRQSFDNVVAAESANKKRRTGGKRGAPADAPKSSISQSLVKAEPGAVPFFSPCSAQSTPRAKRAGSIASDHGLAHSHNSVDGHEGVSNTDGSQNAGK